MKPRARSRRQKRLLQTCSSIPEGFFGQDYKEVAAVLEGLGFTVVIEDYDTSEYEKGAVVDTDPDMGSQVSPGDTISLLVSTGKEDKDDEEDDPGNSENAPGHDDDDD